MKPGQHFDTSDLRSTNRLFKPEAVQAVNDFLNKTRPLAEIKNATLGQLVLRWTLAQPGITGRGRWWAPATPRKPPKMPRRWTCR